MMARLMYERDVRFGRYPYVVQPIQPVDLDTLVAVLTAADVLGSVVFEDGTVRTYSIDRARQAVAAIATIEVTP